MLKGIGYQEYKKMRRVNESLTSTTMEMPGNERYAIYFGRAHLYDFETNTLARGHLKIGRAKFITALQRGRNQPGIDFRVYAEIIVGLDKATHVAEEIIEESLAHRHIILTQGQEEIYNFKDEEIPKVVTTIAEIIESETSFEILEVNLFESNTLIPLRDKKKKSLNPILQNANKFSDMFGE